MTVRCAHCYLNFTDIDNSVAEVCLACRKVLALQNKSLEECADADPEFVRQMRYKLPHEKCRVCKCGRVIRARVSSECHKCRGE